MAEHAPEICPRYHKAVELIGKRWTGAIILAMLSGAVRFSDLGAAIPDMSDRMLSERLKELEAEGIVRRDVHPETPVRIEYGLTRKGRELEPVVAAISAWSERWVEAPEAAPEPAPDRAAGRAAGAGSTPV